jgi:thiol-disulfide isomerase/thioredoxin
MRLSIWLAALLITSSASAQTAPSKLWEELQAKREMLPGLHQEFEVTRSARTARINQESHRKIVLDLSQNRWRERTVSGSDERIRIFDGQDLFLMESEGDEYVHIKRQKKDDDPEPDPYGSFQLDWAKGKELERRPCGFTGTDHTCIMFEVPVKGWMRAGMDSEITRMRDGFSRLAVDSETGMLVQSNTQALIENSRSGYQLTVLYSLKRMSYGSALDATLFKLPESGVHEVKELTRWNASRIRKQLVGKPAPELVVTDIQGNSISLEGLKGKTVLLDFWTTWCPPCLADAPSLEKLYTKYGGKNLAIVSISMNEDRYVVEQFLKNHARSFPTVLTTENELPRPYQIGEFPTYMVIAPDGILTTAVEGDQGFGDLRKFLQKAGMPLE